MKHRGNTVPNPTSADTLTVLYDGACPLCRREIRHVKGLAERSERGGLRFVDVSQAAGCGPEFAADRERLLARFHVERADGSRLDGAEAFVAMWDRLPGWRHLARLARIPGVLGALEYAYNAFLRLRPRLQRLASRREAAQEARCAPGLSLHLTRELRSDHAGETGAVAIYRGIAAVAAWRDEPELLAFADRHGRTEAGHLELIEAWLPAAKRSRLLGPWRLAGWLTGALPALCGRRAVYATIAAVERFVDQHYQQQIDHLRRYGDPAALMPLLLRCQADERSHRDEAAALAGSERPWGLRLWCAVVGAGSAAAVVVARRL